MKLAKLATHPILALIVANTIWGMASPIFKWTLQDMHPLTLGFFRFYLATIFLLPFVYTKLTIARKDILKLLGIGLGLAISIGFFLLGLNLTQSINAPIISSTVPLFMTIAGIIFLGEKPTRKKIMGAIIGFLGVLFIVLIPALRVGFDASVIGNLFLTLSALGSVAQTIFVREVANKYNPMTLIFWTFFLSSLFFFPFMVYEFSLFGVLHEITAKGTLGILFGAIFSSIVAYYLYYMALERLPVLDVSIFHYLDPVVALIIAVPLLGEIPTNEYIIGALLVFVGIYVAERKRHYHPLHRIK